MYSSKIAFACLLFSVGCSPRVVVKDTTEDLAYVEKQIRELKEEMNANMEATVELIKMNQDESMRKLNKRINDCICPMEMK